MAEIIPISSLKDWAIIEQIVSEQLEQAGASHEMSVFVLKRMKRFYQHCSHEFTFEFAVPFPANASAASRGAVDSSLHESVMKIASSIHDYTSKLLLERLLLEIQIYNSGIELGFDS